VRVPHLVHDRLAPDDLAGVGHEQVEQVELAGGELDLLIALRHLSGTGVEHEVTYRDRPSPLGPPASAEDGPDASGELAHRERLHDVVVRPELESQHPVDLLAPSREHQDRDVGRPSDLASQVPTVAVGQHDV
jgi:hypothetical protein